MNPPKMHGWNLALRFGLEIAALIGIGLAAWELTSNPVRWVAVMAAPVAAAAIWGTFNVVDDPSRSGQAPVEVPGWLRLTIELTILSCGGGGFAVAGQRGVAVVFGVLIAVHYAVSWRRVGWLLEN
jgi:CDP-diglyceride synthetase